jgi:uncharacterized membrane protein YdjX (TVP38/TMEM64 family)
MKMDMKEINSKLKMTKEETELIDDFRRAPDEFSIEKQMEVEYKKIIDEIKQDHLKNGSKYKKILIILYSLALVGLFLFYINSPNFSDEDLQTLKTFPNDLEKVKNTVQVLKKYSNENFYYVYFLFIYSYLTLQSLGIVGCGILSVMSGALFSFWTAIITVSLCATTGASICFLLSKSLFSGFLIKYQEKKLAQFSYKVKNNKNSLFLYFISLRFSPIFPNLFVNLGSPIVGVPLKIFFIGTLIGLIPLNIFHIRTGSTLDSISEFGAKPAELGFLMLISVIVLFPTLLKKKNKQIEIDKIKIKKKNN